MNTKEYTIRLEEFIDKKTQALAGRPAGENLLRVFKEKNIILKDLELKFDQILIDIPTRIILLNKSFFLGWMETRVQELGKQAFLLKYKFLGRPFVINKILTDYIDAALLTLKPEEILKLGKH